MKKYILMISAFVVVFGLGVVTQRSHGQAIPLLLQNGWKSGTTTPTSCSPGSDNVFVNTTTVVMYLCGPSGTYLPVASYTSGTATEAATSGNNALVVTGSQTLATGLQITLPIAHTLQAGANTLTYNGTSKNIKSHFNVGNNLGTAYAGSANEITLIYDGTQWEDMSQ